MASVGDILREARVTQKRSIGDIAGTTKIRSNILVALENNELDVLPLPYVKSFVKTYAQLLNVHNREEIKNFLASTSAPKTSPSAPPPAPSAPPKKTPDTAQPESAAPVEKPLLVEKPFPTEKPFPPQRFPGRSSSYINTIVYAGLGLGVLVLIYYFFLYNPAPEPAEVPPSSTTAPVEIRDSGNEPASSFADTPVDSSAVEEIDQQDSLILEARTNARVWISIVADGKRSSQMMLETDNTYHWSADSIFTLSLGNAGGVQFTLNGRPLKPLGRTGAIVRNVKITRAGVLSSNSTFSPPASSNRQAQVVRPRTTATNRSRDRASAPPLITPAETKPTHNPSLPPPEKKQPINEQQ